MTEHQKQLVVALYVQYGTGDFTYESFCKLRSHLGLSDQWTEVTIPVLKEQNYIKVTQGSNDGIASGKWYAVTHQAVKVMQDD